ncbi:MAG: serine hydrolase [Bacteroidota bacterium]
MNRRFIYLISFLVFTTGCSNSKLLIWKLTGTSTYDAVFKLPSVVIENSSNQNFNFTEEFSESLVLPGITLKGKRYNFEEGLDQLGTRAFLIIRSDTIVYERYVESDKDDLLTSFSIAKSFVSALMGIAIEEGAVNAESDPITDYIPELKGKAGFDKITIADLLDMRSGIKYVEQYRPLFSDVAKDFGTSDIKGNIKKLSIQNPADQYLDYKSVNTQLLSYIIENATGKRIYEYLSEKIWKPLGMQSPASWSVDSDEHKQVKAFCCLNATARDYARFGRLYLHNGAWQGKQIIPKNWVQKSTTFSEVKNKFLYTWQWWHNVDYVRYNKGDKLPDLYQFYHEGIDENGVAYKMYRAPKQDYYAEGILGQFIYVHLEKDLIIVRLGEKAGTIPWRLLFESIADAN